MTIETKCFVCPSSQWYGTSVKKIYNFLTNKQLKVLLLLLLHEWIFPVNLFCVVLSPFSCNRFCYWIDACE